MAGESQTRPATGANLWLLLEGELRVQSGVSEWHLRVENAFLVPAGTPRLISTATGATWLSFTFHATLFRQLEALARWPLPHCWTPDAAEWGLLKANLEHLSALWNRPDAALLCDGLARTVFSVCWQACGAPDLLGTEKSPVWVARALEHLQKHPETSISDWARAVGYSDAQFRRRFHEWFHQAPQHYLARHRLELARQQLQFSQKSVAQIGQELGFANLSHFTRAFRRVFGSPPATLRRAMREKL